MDTIHDDSTPYDLSDAGILSDALGWAARAGDTAPAAVRYVRSTRQAAKNLFDGPGPVGDGDMPVICVQVIGHFLSRPLPPQRVRAAGVNSDNRFEGTALEATFDAVTGMVISSGIRIHPKDMSVLGAVTILL